MIPELEPGDSTMATPDDLGMKAHEMHGVYVWQNIPLPVSGDAITRGKADWDRD